MGSGYDIAVGPFTPKASRRSYKKSWPKKIIEVAQRGEGDPDWLAAIALANLGPFHREVPVLWAHTQFLHVDPDAPEIVEKLWDFAKSAYLKSHSFALQEWLVSRFCQARYCKSTRHCGIRWAMANVSSAMLRLRRKPSSRRSSFSRHRRRGGGSSNRFMTALRPSKAQRLADRPDSEIENLIFAASALIFVELTQSECSAGFAANSRGQTRRVSARASGIHQSSSFLRWRASIPVLKSRTTSGSS